MPKMPKCPAAAVVRHDCRVVNCRTNGALIWPLLLTAGTLACQAQLVVSVVLYKQSKTVEIPINNHKESNSRSPEQVQHPGSCSKLHAGQGHLVSCLAHSKFAAIQPSKFRRFIRSARNLSSHIMTAREEAIFLMHDRSSAPQALKTFLQQLKLWAQDRPDKLDPIVLSVALVSVAHVATKADTSDSAATQHPLVYGMAAAMIKAFMQRVSEASHSSICSIFWGCGRSGQMRCNLDVVMSLDKDSLTCRHQQV